jgi:hypothetical protein
MPFLSVRAQVSFLGNGILHLVLLRSQPVILPSPCTHGPWLRMKPQPIIWEHGQKTEQLSLAKRGIMVPRPPSYQNP